MVGKLEGKLTAQTVEFSQFFCSCHLQLSGTFLINVVSFRIHLLCVKMYLDIKPELQLADHFLPYFLVFPSRDHAMPRSSQMKTLVKNDRRKNK